MAKKKGAKKAKKAPAKKAAKKEVRVAASLSATEAKGMAKPGVGLMPLGDKVLIRVFEPSEVGKVLASGIIIPETVDKEKADRGEVVAVGPGKWDEDGARRVPVSVTLGDKVLFQWGDKIEYQGKEYYLVGESNILAVIQ